MKSLLQLCRSGLHFCGKCVLSFAVWTLWLLLVVLLVAQLWILTHRQLAVPAFVLSGLEERLAASQLRASFGPTEFDPSGRVLIHDVSLTPAAFAEPLATARAVYLRLDPWALLAGRFEPLEVRASGVNFFVPAMFSATGRAEAFVRDLVLTVTPDENDLHLQQLTAQVGNVTLTAHGRVRVAPWRHQPGRALPMADFIAQEYPQFSRHAAAVLARLGVLEEPRLLLELTPSATHGAIVNATLLGQGAQLDQPIAAHVTNFEAHTRFPIRSDRTVNTRLDVWADEVSLPGNTVVQGLRAQVRGALQPTDRTFVPKSAEVSAQHLTSAGLTGASLSAQLEWQNPALRGTVLTRVADGAVAATGEVDLAQRAATGHVDAIVTAGVLAAFSQTLPHDLTAWLQLKSAPEVSADVQLGPGWKLRKIDSRFVAQSLTAREVPLDAVTARVHFSGTELRATEIVLRQGENSARGSYTMDTASRDYRFLLQGHLRPLDISGWFREWWPHLFGNFDFSAAVPQADVDVQGRWGETRLSTVFISVAATSPVVRTVAFDRVQTVLFVRPQFYEAREIIATRGPGFARGWFNREVDPTTGTFRRLNFAVTTTADVQEGARLFGPTGLSIVEPFRFDSPPRLRISGHLEGPGAPQGEHQTVHIEGESTGAFRLFNFPLSNLTFTADLHDDDLVIERADASFAGGLASGHVRLWGRGADRQLGFDYTLKNAKLGQAIVTLENFAALRKQTPPPAKSPFLEKASDIRLDLAVSADGKYQDLLSFHGEGNADLTGPELGQVRLLGLLSELLNFTALRFTAMRTHFKLDGSRLVFPEVKLTGANSTIDAKGTYALDRKELDFTAKVFPFGESRFIPQAFIGAVLSPLSQVLEVKLTGQLAKPAWAFVLGPTNFLHNLVSPQPSPQGQPASPTATDPSLSPYLKR